MSTNASRPSPSTVRPPIRPRLRRRLAPRPAHAPAPGPPQPLALPAPRAASWDGPNRRTLGIASLGGATLDNEENYLMKKLYTALGAIQVENQARI